MCLAAKKLRAMQRPSVLKTDVEFCYVRLNLDHAAAKARSPAYQANRKRGSRCNSLQGNIGEHLRTLQDQLDSGSDSSRTCLRFMPPAGPQHYS